MTQILLKNELLRFLRFILIALAAVVVTGYATAIAYLYFEQRHILYDTPHVADVPDIPGLDIADVRIKTPDGETLQAWYEPPEKGMPVFLFFHGQGGTLALSKGRYLRMHKEGVGFLALAYRGYSASTGTPSEKGLLIDGLAAYDWLSAKGFTPQDVIIHGHSLGSGVAVYVATQRPARALILEAPFTAAEDVAQARYPFMPVDALMADKFLSRERIKDVHMPVLIAHGDRDSVIPFAEGQKLYALANPPKVFVRMHNSDHNTLTRDGVYEYYWKFLGLPPEDEKAALTAP